MAIVDGTTTADTSTVIGGPFAMLTDVGDGIFVCRTRFTSKKPAIRLLPNIPSRSYYMTDEATLTSIRSELAAGFPPLVQTISVHDIHGLYERYCARPFKYNQGFPPPYMVTLFGETQTDRPVLRFEVRHDEEPTYSRVQSYRTTIPADWNGDWSTLMWQARYGADGDPSGTLRDIAEEIFDTTVMCEWDQPSRDVYVVNHVTIAYNIEVTRNCVDHSSLVLNLGTKVMW